MKQAALNHGRECPAPADDLSTERDEDVVRRVLAGDVEAFEAIIRRHNQRLYRLARAIVGRDHDARDVVQEAYVQAYLHLGSFRGPDGFASWLRVIVRNRALMLLRQRAREHPTEPEALEALLGAGADAADPRSALETERLRRDLDCAVDRLPGAFRAVFVLRAVDGMSVRETAQVLGLHETTVKTRLFRARRLLRRHLGRRLQGDGVQVHEGSGVYQFAGARCNAMTAAVMARLRV